MGTLNERVRVKLYGVLDGMYKAVYDTREAQLTITFGTAKAVLDEYECDNLLRVAECAVNPSEDLAEFFGDLPGFSGIGYVVAKSFIANQVKLAELVYAD
jgi:hypothetical protein